MLTLGLLDTLFLPQKLQHYFAAVPSGLVCKCGQVMPAKLKGPRNYSLHPADKIVQVLPCLIWVVWSYSSLSTRTGTQSAG